MQRPSSVNSYASTVDVAECRAALRGGSRTFFAASLALPHSVREPASGLYAFCRMADDAIDQGRDRAAALIDLRRRLDAVYAGVPYPVAADRAFADCVARYAIPQDFPAALLDGFEWDAMNRRYETLSDLKAYGVRVAGTVGAMMAMVMNVRDRRLIAHACELGVAMQLTNIARDVGEDALCGRLYLPLQWLRKAGIDPLAWLERPLYSPALGHVVERLLAEAEILYARSDAGLSGLPAACRPGMYAARLLYAEIGHEVARRGFDSVNQRAVVSWRRKARILADALIAAGRAPHFATAEPLPEASFLVDVVPHSFEAPDMPEESERERARWPRVEDRVAWLVDLFERLERRDQAPLAR